MEWEIILMFLVIAVTIGLFIFEVFSIDKIAFLIIVTLILLGLVTPEEGVSGFSNSATIAVLALMILAIAMEENGVIHWLTSGMGKVKSMPLTIIAPIFMFVTASISAFISTTAVVIVFIKIVNQLSEKYKIPQSKLLLPISFAGIIGGSCTLMGTSTNLIVNSVAKSQGEARIGFFEFSLLGLIFLSVTIIYLTITLRWLPWDKQQTLSKGYNIDNYLTKVRINPESQIVGKKIQDSFLFENPDLTLLQLTRNNNIQKSPGKYITLKEGDELLLLCNIESLTYIKAAENLKIYEENNLDSKELNEEAFIEANITEVEEVDERVFVELLMLPGASLLGESLGSLRTFMTQDVIPLAIKKRKTVRNLKGRLSTNTSNRLQLEVGDQLLVEISKEKIGSLHSIENVVILNEFDKVNIQSNFKKYFSLGVLIMVIVLSATGLLSIMVSALTGVSLLLLTNNLDLKSVYKKVNWQIFFLLAGMIPLGFAMHNTHADQWISENLLAILKGQPNFIIIGVLFLVTMLLSGVVSNNATAIIMTPIAIAVAHGMSLDAKPFILSIMFAANFSFFTPMGYQTNTLIYGIGNYRFKHFLYIGGVLSFILWILATFLLTRML
ncbi:SLC13 family permease [Flavobacterium algicola]|uniref:SLC13 family permease n=1 Tax=Flavobacterium algicola TaxID=556529 RepID=UPI001EFD5A01|nr:SLC13 family permease [Flavobacterium algicola]MCG9791179.1 SLC13 family permease [Flavobacterium algicola]